MKRVPRIVRTALLALVLALPFAALRAQDPEPQRDNFSTTIVGTIQLQPGEDRYPDSIRVILEGVDYHDNTTPTRGGNFIFSGVPDGPIVIEVMAPGFETTRTEFRGWSSATDFVVPLGRSSEQPLPLTPGSATVDVHNLKIPEKAMKLAARAQEASDRNHLDKAVEWLQEAVKISPNFVGAWNNMGVDCLRMGKQKEAEAAFLKALQTDSRSVPALRNLGFLYLLTERSHEAVSVLQRARDASTEKDLYIETYLGHALYQTGQFQEAEIALKGAIEMKPDFPAALYPLALTQVQLHEFQQARDNFARFLRSNDKGVEADAARSAVARLDKFLNSDEQPKTASNTEMRER